MNAPANAATNVNSATPALSAERARQYLDSAQRAAKPLAALPYATVAFCYDHHSQACVEILWVSIEKALVEGLFKKEPGKFAETAAVYNNILPRNLEIPNAIRGLVSALLAPTVKGQNPQERFDAITKCLELLEEKGTAAITIFLTRKVIASFGKTTNAPLELPLRLGHLCIKLADLEFAKHCLDWAKKINGWDQRVKDLSTAIFSSEHLTNTNALQAHALPSAVPPANADTQIQKEPTVIEPRESDRIDEIIAREEISLSEAYTAVGALLEPECDRADRLALCVTIFKRLPYQESDRQALEMLSQDIEANITRQIDAEDLAGGGSARRTELEQILRDLRLHTLAGKCSHIASYTNLCAYAQALRAAHQYETSLQIYCKIQERHPEHSLQTLPEIAALAALQRPPDYWSAYGAMQKMQQDTQPENSADGISALLRGVNILAKLCKALEKGSFLREKLQTLAIDCLSRTLIVADGRTRGARALQNLERYLGIDLGGGKENGNMGAVV